MNEDMAYFPPFFSEEYILDEDELMDIVEVSIPFSWQKQLLLQGFEISEHMLQELVEFCEHLEVTEDLFKDTQTSKKKSGQSSHASPEESKLTGTKRVTSDKSSEGGSPSKKCKMEQKWCALHEVDMHDTSECKVMLQQANKLWQSWKAQPKKFAQCKSGNPNQTEEPQEEANQMLKKPSKSTQTQDQS